MFNQNVPLLELSRATLPTHAAVPDHDKKRRIASLPEQVRGQPYLTVLYCTALHCTALYCTVLVFRATTPGCQRSCTSYAPSLSAR